MATSSLWAPVATALPLSAVTTDRKPIVDEVFVGPTDPIKPLSKYKLPRIRKVPLARPTERPKPKVLAAPGGSCSQWLAQAGITDPDAIWLISKESGCDPAAVNPDSGACGIPQALPCSKMNCSLNDPVCQLRWMQSYVMGRYGSWAAARAHHQANNWY